MRSNSTYNRLINTIGVYQALSDAMACIEKVSTEMQRLMELKLTSKTVDKQLFEHIESELIIPNKMLVERLERVTQSSEVSNELKGLAHSLAGVIRQLEAKVKGTSKTTQAGNETSFEDTRTCSPAA